MRTTTVALRALLAGVAVLVSEPASAPDIPVHQLGANKVVGLGAWTTALPFDHLLAISLDPLKNGKPKAPARGAERLAVSSITPTPIRKPASLRVSSGAVLTAQADLTSSKSSKAAELLGSRSITDDPGAASRRLAQFQVPTSADKKKDGKTPELPKYLEYQYAYGSESEVNYRSNPDLDERVSDNALILTPQVGGYVTYRPAEWLEMTLEMILERDIAVREEDRIVLPSGDIKLKQKRRFSLLVDQAFVTIKNVIEPVEFTVGRKNFEDGRHWLYDTSMDVAMVAVKHGKFRTQAVLGREILLDMDVFQKEPTDKIDTLMVDTEYRGIEDIKIAAYAINRKDKSREEGNRWLMGVRSQGMPTESFSYWTDLAFLFGRDSRSHRIEGYALDVGATYRLTHLRFMPNATLGFALGSGDRNSSDRTNNDFHQTGLESNEVKFAGLADFKGYGEAFDPELSNLKILTVGAGIRPAPNVSVDLVYHQYWLDRLTDDLPNTALTAEVNQVDTITSKDVGSGIDVVLGFRSVFNIPRLGLDLRAGLFFPKDAYLIDESTNQQVLYRRPDNGSSVIMKFWW